MRKFFICAIVALLSIVSTTAIAGSDDVMITRDGSFINVKVLRISNSDVSFINLDKKRQGELKAPTDFVYMIMKEKGSNVLFDEEGNQMTSAHVKLDKKDNVLFLNNGKFFPVFNVEIGKNDISYKLKDSKKAPVEKVAKDEVFLLKNSDGTTTLFNNKYVEKLRKAKAAAQAKAAAAPTLPGAQMPTAQPAPALTAPASTTLTSQAVPAPSTQAAPAIPAAPSASNVATGGLKFSPAPALSDDEIIRRVYAKQPYTLYGKGTVAEYIIMKGDKQSVFMGLPTYVQQVVAEEKVSNGLLGVYVKQVLLNKKHEPSKGISAAFKSYYYPTEIDTAGTFHLTHDISRDFVLLTSRQGYAMLLPSMLNVGDKLKCGTIADNSKNLFGGTVKLKAEYTDFYVDGTETVTTPAGTFDCIRLKGKVFEDNSAYKSNYQYTWWLARGVGFVKYEMLNVEGKEPNVPTTILLNKLERP